MTVEAALHGARVRYGPLEALHGVDLPFPAGAVTVLLGRNGAGRTSALHALAGVMRLAAGRVEWQGRDVTALSVHRRVRLGLALVPAERAVFASLTVAEHLGLAGSGTGPAPVPAATDEALELFPELTALLPRRAGTLSGGQQQLVAVARALSTGPRLLLLDEPDRGLAPAVTARLHAHLLALAAAEGRTVVLTAQSLPHGLAGAAVVHVLHRGEVGFSGEPAELGAQQAAERRPTGPGP
ncbi:ATP-binding cassette domain-containing protein [Kitasatospora sp. CM 4170]|uniref:ATP-binding cassette domain-containing protein n=1 Tax=Kitasatospora aburaviensis TaxID=67265 RepID=A0ABW1EPC6_9ACTN|nr:ATP-binding cassette domain-containing protein [Kitasatospora sp. CM 4170]WNM48420.1 ATP-binding cassette domain-containing protein [Kitasatospora sp. CM 4170]